MAAGDHLYVACRGYTHHGVDMGDGSVIHFDADPWQKVGAGESIENPAMIRQVGYLDFVKGREVRVWDYAASDPPGLVLARARSRIGEQNYDLLHNNCEHFAVWCKTGRADSYQVRAALYATRPLREELPLGLFALRMTRRLPAKYRLLASGAVAVATVGSMAVRYLRDSVRSKEFGG